ncbi:glycoside hydrolase [Sphingomonas oleivorans]|uniref:Glycoside hydrolase n=1 Tax=Sphingomonas oleivorans TaxID=1735121 RepID=A0A2T5FV64_9SPHN|nr:NlpC/P60 family protein [Sphingomonas oleivorans]PTQ08622.1 glycoside hydrolase [Sphingomonas oleivorans]
MQPPTERFRLDGPTRALDPRVHAVRRDIADIALAGLLFAPHYAQPLPRACAAASAMLRTAPAEDAEAVSQLLRGERFDVLDIAGGWAWGYCVHDDYVGYVPTDSLSEPAPADHIVTAPSALLFSRPDIKSPVRAVWPVGARFAGIASDAFVETEQGFIHQRHAAPLTTIAADPVTVAESLLGLPYLWGGRGGDGIDCSGLVQQALARTGHAAPRDTDQQRSAIGEEIAEDAPLRRGDLIFFPGHVGLMVDGTRLIHANAHWMAVTVEPLADVVTRLLPNHDRPILARRRITS